ncbi:MAG: tRNA(adenine34) deaminase [Halieaceae bacterium]
MHPLEPDKDDVRWMERALELAECGALEGEVPVGAVLIREGELLGEGWNRPIGNHDASAHAEICALRMAGARLRNYRIPGSTLYVTLEPCSMCAGALVHARIRRLVFATREPKSGIVCSNGNFFAADHLNHQIDWSEGVLADRASEMLSTFFRKRRAQL